MTYQPSLRSAVSPWSAQYHVHTNAPITTPAMASATSSPVRATATPLDTASRTRSPRPVRTKPADTAVTPRPAIEPTHRCSRGSRPGCKRRQASQCPAHPPVHTTSPAMPALRQSASMKSAAVEKADPMAAASAVMRARLTYSAQPTPFRSVGSAAWVCHIHLARAKKTGTPTIVIASGPASSEPRSATVSERRLPMRPERPVAATTNAA